jgi:hypothetical protein
MEKWNNGKGVNKLVSVFNTQDSSIPAFQYSGLRISSLEA